ncbi:hypothetical protein SAMN04488691_105131 [Haloferax larsenii]|uniref:Uncharacterized protein n=1 Tax=Haloferax larsenii TaxID=302484 RepID=A0A1H7QRP5_HALLR|nr:hypothetical protein SAMN04488691_105131 [Haloferax larsenii]
MEHKNNSNDGGKDIRKLTDAGNICLPADSRIDDGYYIVETHADGSYTLQPLSIDGDTQ